MTDDDDFNAWAWAIANARPPLTAAQFEVVQRTWGRVDLTVDDDQRTEEAAG